MEQYCVRLKTKEEFGERWRGRVNGSFVDGMDYLLGMDVVIDLIHGEGRCIMTREGVEGGWTISTDMITGIDQ